MSVHTLPVLPLTDTVVLPGMVLPVELDAERQAAVDAARTAAGSGPRSGIRSTDPSARVLLVPRLDGRYGAVGVVAEIAQVGRLPDGRTAAVVRAIQRARVGAGVTGPGAALWVEATPVEDPVADARTSDLAAEYKQVLTALLQQRGAWQVVDSIERITDPAELADSAGYASWLDVAHKAELLETFDPARRLELLIEWTRARLTEVEVAEKIREDVRESMESTQREYLLRQQLAAIRKELGEGEPDGADDYRTRVEQADLPPKVMEAALAEVAKLERASEQSPESGWIRTWLDTVLELPWSVRTTDSSDVTAARAVLDADHAGLDDVKERITEYLAVRARRAARGLEVVGGRGSGAVLALVGPPGVGKTSLGESVARTLGRRFVRVALGGVRDEAEVRGHRRTYVGALPGRIVRAIKEAGSMNPVVLLDEVDKLGTDFRGDPAAALLEVLDPAQNHTFRDHYLEVELDLSDVLFLATANVAEAIPEALSDRMEVVRLDGYTEDEKVLIARDHLLPRQLSRAALDTSEVAITEETLRLIAADYTREAGVRQLERALARILRKVATKLATSPEVGTERDQGSAPVRVDVDDVVTYLGRPRFTSESAERTAVPGVATGLAVTGAGGDVLFVEAAAMAGEPGLALTGQLGDVMKESAQIALSYLRSNGPALGVPVESLADRRVHVHVPAGAVPKDGPSAGVTMTTALASLLSGRPVRSEVGMTGEVSLTGRVLPIGGVKQKLLAAHRAGLTEVVLPGAQRGRPRRRAASRARPAGRAPGQRCRRRPAHRARTGRRREAGRLSRSERSGRLTVARARPRCQTRRVPLEITAEPANPALLDLPWSTPLEEWPADYLVALPRGISRHVVRFIRIYDRIYAVKEVYRDLAVKEYDLLRALEHLDEPAVEVVALVDGRETSDGEPLDPALITRHLQFSLPYRALFSGTLRPETSTRLLDALAVLLVRLHSAGFFWGDCSLSNVLFRRDAGAFAAYLVDAETGELHPKLSDGQRGYDIEVAHLNLFGELLDLEAGGFLHPSFDPSVLAQTVVRRYEELWDEITRAEFFPSAERHRIESRLRRLNDLGFDVDELQVLRDPRGDIVRVFPKVVDAGHHQRRLLRLTGLDVEENQARRLLNDLDAFRAAHGLENEEEAIVAHQWLNDAFLPTVMSLPPDLAGKLDPAEVYHEVLEHRWFLSEAAGHDVGLPAAAQSYVENVLAFKPDEKAVLGALDGPDATAP